MRTGRDWTTGGSAGEEEEEAFGSSAGHEYGMCEKEDPTFGMAITLTSSGGHCLAQMRGRPRDNGHL